MVSNSPRSWTFQESFRSDVRRFGRVRLRQGFLTRV
jgi:hypothetical protein